MIFTPLVTYVLLWAFCWLIIMPIVTSKLHDENGKRGEGHADSAPTHFPGRKLLIYTTVTATVLFIVWQANLWFGWITLDMVNWYN